MPKAVTKENGQSTWIQQKGDVYLCTGIDCSGKRFRRSSTNWMYISMINVYRGSKWLVRNNQRFLISRHYN